MLNRFPLTEAEMWYQWSKTLRFCTILTHTRPDADAIGSTLGLATLYRSMGIEAYVYLDPQMKSCYQSRLGTHPLVLPASSELVLPLIVVDCSETKNLALPKDPSCFAFEWQIDHHETNNIPAYNRLIVPEASATTSILTNLARYYKLPLNEESASFFLMGIYGDTGGFRYTNTHREDFEDASFLLSQGANLQKIVELLYFSRSWASLKLQGYAIDNLQVSPDGKLAYFSISTKVLETYQAQETDTDELIDLIRVIPEIPVYVKIQETYKNSIRFSFRSQSIDYPVLPLAQKLGGGGHLLAAGATVPNITIKEAESLLLQLWEHIRHE